MALSEAQMRALEKMAGGDELWTTTGINPIIFWRDHLAWRAPRFPTLHALSTSGMIEAYDKDGAGSKYRITEAGRRALKEQRE